MHHTRNKQQTHTHVVFLIKLQVHTQELSYMYLSPVSTVQTLALEMAEEEKQ